jgi:hypothetical protein
LSEAGSGIEGMRHDSAFARLVAASLNSETFKLVDVGCAGGLTTGFRTFGERLQAVGFDGNAEEIARLQAAEKNPLVSYVAGLVGLPPSHPLRLHQGRRYSDRAYWHMWVDKRLSYERTFDVRAARAEGREPRSIEDFYKEVVLAQDWTPFPLSGFDLDYVRAFEAVEPTAEEVAAALAAPAEAEEIYLPAYLQAAGFTDADFIKVDVDGPDFDVLRSLGPIVKEPSVLGVALEVCFYGSHDANDNSFHNTDRLMRQKGFDLFGLSVRKYGSAALPSRYLDWHPSMTVDGRPVQGDAIYIRDFSSRARKAEAAAVSDEKLAKAAAIFALFTLPDYAAELLLVHRERLQNVLDVEAALNVLAAEIQPYADPVLGYRDYIARFEADDDQFYDEYGKKNLWHQRILSAANALPAAESQLQAKAQEAEAARCDLAAAQAEAEAARSEAEKLRARLLDAQGRADAIESSTLWRSLAPLRRAAGRLRGRR